MSDYYSRKLLVWRYSMLLSCCWYLKSCSGTAEKEILPSSWHAKDFPNPSKEPDRCRSEYMCDPDSVLSDEEQQSLNEFLQLPRYILHPQSSNEQEDDNGHDDENADNPNKNMIPMQLSVVLMQKMDLFEYGVGREEQAAEDFARHLHDQWGLGVVVVEEEEVSCSADDVQKDDSTTCTGAFSTGVLFFLSVEDRAMYISRGAGSFMEESLPGYRLEYIMEDIRPLLQDESYHDAILRALQTIQHYLETGPPSFREEFLHNILFAWIVPITWMSAIIGLICRQQYTDYRQRRIYAQVSTQLSQLDRSRAQALQGKYKATSCPICLEDFQIDNQNTDNQNTHDENTDNHNTDNQNTDNQNTLDEKPMLGSDGLPLKLLRCGHVFDQTCWETWVTSGRGNITKCPICNQDIGSATNDTNMASSSVDASETTQPASSSTEPNRPQESPQETNVQEQRTESPEEHERTDIVNHQHGMLRQYQQERNFRLQRLAVRFPQFIRPHQIQQWSQPNYQGSLVNDKSFVQSNPSRQASGSNHHGGSNHLSGMGGSNFGGGFSGGGRGGRW